MAGKHCVVIGAGLAGLAAAYRAVQNGWTVDVLEADKDRLGGRVFTKNVQSEDGRTLFYELGGEWVGSNHTRLKELCEHFELPLQDHRFSFAFLERGGMSRQFEPGTSPFSATAQEAFGKFSERLKAANDCEKKSLDGIDWWTKLKHIGFSQHDLDLRDQMDSTDFGESIRHTSAFVGASEYVFGNRFDEMDKKIVGGNDKLPLAFAKSINKDKKRVHLDSTVTQIEQSNGSVTVTTHAGQKFTGDACICAIPASCLHKIHWHPALPEEQRAAADELQYARIMKTAIYFKERFWLRDNARSGFSMFSNRASDFCFESTFGQEGTGGVICSYAIGDKADDLADEKESDLARWISEDMSTAIGRASFAGSFLHRKPWQRDECIGGAYAFYRPGQWFRVRPALARPHGRVAFAGEHLSEPWQGFMEGAVETGEAAADGL
jgi:monoamine oxidase